MKVSGTMLPEDIQTGARASPYGCPVVKALTRILGRELRTAPFEVVVGIDSAWLYIFPHTKEVQSYRANLGMLGLWTIDFDYGRPVEPVLIDLSFERMY